MNISTVSTLSLDGLAQLYKDRFLFLVLFLLLYVFVLLSDSLVVYIICSQRSLHRPMYVFVAAMLMNSMVCSTAVYPKLLWDLLQGQRVVLLSRLACLCQAFVLGSLGSSSFLLLSVMALDRYLSICYPLRYATLMSPTSVTTLLLLCWLLPPCRAAGAIFLANRLPICHTQITRIYCDTYSLISMGCAGLSSQISNAYSLMGAIIFVILPAGFVLFTYGCILVVCIQRSKAFSTKALNTCLPHILVFLNFSLTATFEIVHRRLVARGITVTASIVVVVVPSVFNPVIYGLKVAEVFKHVKRLLHFPRATKTQSTLITKQ